MKAIASTEYGPPDRLTLREVDMPAVGADGVLVRVQAASLNPLDWHLLRGEPYLVRLSDGLRRPKRSVPGVDVAGYVEVVGENVSEFRPGDEVFGARGGSLAEYVCGTEKNFVPKPAGLSFEAAAAIPIAGVTALQAVRDKGRQQPGQRVLVNGAAGGVGTFAVQIAKALGGEVTGVCSTQNVELVRSIGADTVVDYTEQDFTRNGRRYDLIVDTASTHSLWACRSVLTPKGTLVIVGATKVGNVVGPIIRPLGALALSVFVGQRLVPFLAKVTKADLVTLAELVASGALTPVIERTYPLSDAAAAVGYLEAGHARGKVVITV
jgi:NADPH:quinone reductase-like Zn-dependent oxidoreductase